MSDSALLPSKGQRQAMCVDCGAIRSARSQYLGRGFRTLRCVACDRVTTHAAVNWDGTDPRELANRRRSEAQAEASRNYAALLELFECCHIQVLTGTDSVQPAAEPEPQGGLIEVIRWLDSDSYQVRLRSELAIEDRVYCLDWAWRSMRPAIAEWDRCLVEFDIHGQGFQRIYNNELERGIYTLS
ncbi:MAG TPA: hypothetical protein VEQ66_08875 [Propionibacteriaceae bacterium]|nr:hypothetical protein [Propionibacteriaceae bacterium]